jgi:glycosyltransferase involved in cell wall biosynthesis
MTAVSVISVFHNRAEGVARTVESLLAQDHPDLDIVLVDDGSTDATGAALRRYKDPRLRLQSHGNIGFVAALKRAIAATQSPYIALLGSGDACRPTRLSRQANTLDERATVGAVGCGTENLDPETGRVISHKIAQLRQPAARMMLTRNPFHHGEIMFRRALYEAVGGYRDFFVFAQDRDLVCRFSHRTEFHIVDDILYSRYARLPGSVSASPEKLLLQRCLSDFAVYCHAQRLKGLPDPLDTYGPAAALLRPSSPRLARELRSIGLGALRRGDLEKARTFLTYAEEYYAHPLSALGLAAVEAADRLRPHAHHAEDACPPPFGADSR